MTKINRRSVKLSDAEQARHDEIRRQVEAEKPRMDREALAHKAELDVRIEAFARLRDERNKRGLSLADVSQATGIDRSYLSKLENDPYPNPTLSTLVRVAEAIGVKVEINLSSKEAA